MFMWGLDVIWPYYTVSHLTPKKRREGWRLRSTLIPAAVNLKKSSNLNFSPKFSPSGPFS